MSPANYPGRSVFFFFLLLFLLLFPNLQIAIRIVQFTLFFFSLFLLVFLFLLVTVEWKGYNRTRKATVFFIKKFLLTFFFYSAVPTAVCWAFFFLFGVVPPPPSFFFFFKPFFFDMCVCVCVCALRKLFFFPFFFVDGIVAAVAYLIHWLSLTPSLFFFLSFFFFLLRVFFSVCTVVHSRHGTSAKQSREGAAQGAAPTASSARRILRFPLERCIQSRVLHRAHTTLRRCGSAAVQQHDENDAPS